MTWNDFRINCRDGPGGAHSWKSKADTYDAGGTSSTGEWTYVKGPSPVSQPGTYGLPPAAEDYPNVVSFPGTRWGPAYWSRGGYFWLFGGQGYDSTTSSGGIGLMNDLWRYLPYP
jgi:hypothetical protein